MFRQKCDLWKAGSVLAGVLFLLVIGVWVSVATAHAQQTTLGSATPGTETATPTVDATVAALQKEQLILQDKQLQQSEDRGFVAWLWNNAAAIVASLLSTLVVVVGALIGLYQWRGNRNHERQKELAAQEKEAKDRKEAQEKELRERAEERFQTAVAALGSENPATRVGGATLLRSFLNPEDKELYGRYYTQIFDLIVSHLRLRYVNPDSPEPLDALTQALATVFKEVFPLARALFEQNHQNLLNLDAIGVRLDGAYLARSDLRGVRLPEAYLRKVNFHEVDLRDANLREAKLYDSKLTEADLSRTNLAGADLREAHFTNTRLTKANLDRANLSGANLRGANIEEALSLRRTNLQGVQGLTKEQLAACKAKGAIIDEETMNRVPQSSVPSAQVNTPPTNTDGSSNISSQLGSEL